LIFSTTVLLALNIEKGIAGNHKINALIGNISFVEKFGEKPNEFTDEQLRIKTHLEYVDQLLIQKDVSDLSALQKKNRKQNIDLLHEYHTAGIFPKNYDYIDQRKPCFIDKDGNICAVGYLIEKTAGLELAEQINNEYQYAYIYDMDIADVEMWISESGLTLEECAMIQPTYGTIIEDKKDENNSIPLEYTVSSTLLGGTNAVVSTINFLQLKNGQYNKRVPSIGLLTGIGSIALGFMNLEQDINSEYYNNDKNTLSFTNIGIGTCTLLLSSYNIIANKNQLDKKKTYLNFYSILLKDQKIEFSINLTKTF